MKRVKLGENVGQNREMREAGEAGVGGRSDDKNVLAAHDSGCAVIEGDFECHNQLIRVNGCGYVYLQIYVQTRKA